LKGGVGPTPYLRPWDISADKGRENIFGLRAILGKFLPKGGKSKSVDTPTGCVSTRGLGKSESKLRARRPRSLASGIRTHEEKKQNRGEEIASEERRKSFLPADGKG